MGEKFESSSRSLKLTPHEEEDIFDYRKALHEQEDMSDLYVIYEDEDFKEEVKQKITELGFSFTGKRWESESPISIDTIEELELDGISVIKI